jgi:hypothetical protein
MAREREEDEKWKQRMMEKFAEDDRIGTAQSSPTLQIRIRAWE